MKKMKKMKKMMSVFLAIVMMLSMTTGVFAIAPDDYTAPTTLGNEEVMISVLDCDAVYDATATTTNAANLEDGEKMYDATMTVRLTFKNTDYKNIDSATIVTKITDSIYPDSIYPTTKSVVGVADGASAMSLANPHQIDALTALSTRSTKVTANMPGEAGYYIFRDTVSPRISYVSAHDNGNGTSYIDLTMKFNDFVSTEGSQIPVIYTPYTNISNSLLALDLSKKDDTNGPNQVASGTISGPANDEAYTGYINIPISDHSVKFTDGKGNDIHEVTVPDGDTIPTDNFDTAEGGFTPPDDKELLGWEDEDGNLVDPTTPITEDKILSPVYGDVTESETGMDSIKADHFTFGINDAPMTTAMATNLSHVAAWAPDNSPYTTAQVVASSTALATKIGQINVGIGNGTIKAGDTTTMTFISSNTDPSKVKTATITITFTDAGSGGEETPDQLEPYVTGNNFTWPISNGSLEPDEVLTESEASATDENGDSVDPTTLVPKQADVDKINDAIAAGDPVNPDRTDGTWPVEIANPDNSKKCTIYVTLTASTITIKDDGEETDLIKVMRTNANGITDPAITSEPYSYAKTSKIVDIEVNGTAATSAQINTLISGMSYEIYDISTQDFVNAPTGFTLDLTAGNGKMTIASKTSKIVRMTSTLYGGTFELTVIVPGDVNQDGAMDASDWSEVLNYVNDDPGTYFVEYKYNGLPFWKFMADMDSDTTKAANVLVAANDWTTLMCIANDSF